MRLIKNGRSRNLHSMKYDENEVPQYAILSHTWGKDDEEVTAQDIEEGQNETKAGWKKVEFCRKQAAKDNIQHFWIDTCCIVKENFTELHEAINSMFHWYQRAAKCYVYLADVSMNGYGQTVSSGDTTWEETFQRSRWFRRGWTLQELLAPKVVEFYSKEGHLLGSKKSLEQQIQHITGIPVEALRGRPLTEFSVDERLRWAEIRETRQQEDKAYSMFGIFEVYMPLLYGEGKEKAFRRLRGKIRKADAGLSTEEDRCLQSFYPSGIDYDEQKNQNPDRVPNTCLWTLQNSKYLDWRDRNTKPLLWISADPGCGKSVLAKCIVDEDLPNAFRNDSSKLILYYFFKDTSADQRSACRAICTILHQLFSFYPQLIQHALPRFKESGAALSTELLNLCAIFRKAVIDPAAGEIICVIDALDECNEHEQSKMIAFLEGFCLKQQNLFAIPHVKFLITSRPDFKIRQGFDKLLEESDNIELAGTDESKSIMKEIDLVIKYQVVKLKQELRLSQQVGDHLEKRLLAIEHRTYLWLHLLWNIIRKNQHGNKSGFNKLIDNLPADVYDCYEHLLQKSPDPEFANKVLRIVLVAARPLTVAELDVAINMNTQALSYADLEEEQEGHRRIKDTLPSRCGMMISVIQSKVYFIHQTIKEFLLQKAGMGHQTGQGWQDSMYLTGSHLLMSKICLQNMCFRDVHLDQADIFGALLPVEDRELEANDFCQTRPFLSYSAIYWADHFLQGDDHSIEIVENLLETGRGQLVKGRYPPDYVSQLYAASAGGHLIIAQLLLDRGANVNAKGGKYGNALQAASIRGYDAVVRILLDRGANINAKGGIYSNALYAASIRGYNAVVRILLDKGANFNAEGGIYSNALQAASYGGHKAVVQMLLDRGANVNAKGGEYGHALQAASYRGYEAVVQILLDRGANINAKGGTYSNALHTASMEGYDAVVRILLDRGANVNAKGGIYGNALQAASYGGYKAVVQMLLDRGANVNAKGGEYGHALQAASYRGYDIVVRILLDRGANVNAKGGEHSNALQAASIGGYNTVVRILLDRGANVNAKGGEYSNALQAASIRGYDAVVRILLDRGANINAEGGVYGNALQAASYRGYKAVVQILLDRGANVNAEGSIYGNALQAASYRGHKAVVQILLDRGANINAKGGKYSNALQAASEGGYNTVVRILLDRGANVNAESGIYSNAL